MPFDHRKQDQSLIGLHRRVSALEKKAGIKTPEELDQEQEEKEAKEEAKAAAKRKADLETIELGGAHATSTKDTKDASAKGRAAE